MNTKICKTCKQEKDLSAFYNNKKCKFGVTTICKECVLKRVRLNPRNQKLWKLNNKEKIIKYQKNYQNRTINRIIKGLKGRIGNLQNRFSNCYEMIGCSKEQLEKHLESLFLDGMTWENYGKGKGKWQIDHIKPVYLFDQENLEDLKSLNNYTNIRPLWENDNMEKGKKELTDYVNKQNILKSQKTHKICPQCNQLKNITEDFRLITTTKKYKSYCKNCEKIYAKNHYKNYYSHMSPKEKALYLEKVAKYKLENKEKIQQYHKERYIQKQNRKSLDNPI